MKRYVILATVAGLALCGAGHLSAQAAERCGSPWDFSGVRFLDLARAAAVTDTTRAWSPILRGGAPLDRSACGAAAASGSAFRANLTPAFLVTQLNSGYPRDFLDGLRWAGRGVSMGVNAGVVAGWGPFSAAFTPVVTFQQNRAFPILRVTTPGYSPYASYWHTTSIDLPQRFGPSSFWWASLGQSYVQARAYGVRLGFSTENLRWGPARRNPLLMSGTGPGFPHVYVGTSRATDVWIGRLQAEAIWGHLGESAYFDTLSTDNKRLFAGIVLALQPRVLDGLTLGFARSYQRYIPPSGLSLWRQFFDPYRSVGVNSATGSGYEDDQLMSVFARWAFPASGFEAYLEYAREDHWQNLLDLAMEPDHSRAYTVGFQKIYTNLPGPGRRLRISGEVTNLNSSPTWESGRGGAVNFYTHGQIHQGYTQDGQLLGAPIGPGSDSWYLGVDLLEAAGRVYGIDLERIRYDNDTYYQQLAAEYGHRGHDLELTASVHAAADVGGLQLVGELGYSYRWDRGFVGMLNGYNLPHDSNVSLTLGAAWWPR